MKKIITMVGTSLFENYFEKENNDSIKHFYETLKSKRNKDWDNEKSRIEKIRNLIQNWIEKQRDKNNVSAEIKSLVKLKEELDDDLEIYLLCSDTILSRLAGEVIKEIIPDIEILKIKAQDEVKLKIIDGLQIWDRKEFNKGMSNLISEVYSIAQENWDNIVINITGGYKATIPYLTIMAQLNMCPIYYIFEETDALIKVPNIPFSKNLLNVKELQNYERELEILNKGVVGSPEYERLKSSDFYSNFSFLIWDDEKDKLLELNPIGKIFYERYKEMFFVFYTTENCKKILENDIEIKELFHKKFSNKNIRESKTEIKNGHYVYDDGDNKKRVFYKKAKENNTEVIYVYEIFNDHDKYERFLRENPYSEEKYQQYKFEKFRIKKEEVSYV